MRNLGTAGWLAFLAFTMATPALSSALSAFPASFGAYADSYPAPLHPPAALAPKSIVLAPIPAALADEPGSIRMDIAPTPMLLDADGNALAPAKCNQGTPSSGAGGPLQFCCPTTLAPLGTSTEGIQGDRYDYTDCPFRIYDTAGGVTANGRAATTYRFGNPQITVNRNDEREVAFCSLHGNAIDGPTPRTRVSSQAQTTFTSHDQGITWEDQPPIGTPGLGESASCTMDGDGNVYLGYLYSRDNGNATTGYGSALWLLKAGATRDQGSVNQAYGGGYELQGRTPMNPIQALNVVDIPPYEPPAPPANATYGPPANSTDIGKAAVSTATGPERVGAVWFERCTEYARNVNASDACQTSRGMPGWIDAAFTTTAPDDSWDRLENRQLIGPCMDASNPVAWDGQVYVACEVERGYSARSRARIGEIDIWRIDPATGNTTLVESTHMIGGHPLLAATKDGYMVMVTTKHIGPIGAEVHAAFGWYGTHWTDLGVDMGPQLHRLAGSVNVRDAAVTALSISQRERTSILEYMEWQHVTNVSNLPSPIPPDPTNPQPPSVAIKDFTKILTTFNACNPTIGAARMELGTKVDADNLDAYSEQPSIFDDSQDGLQSYTETTGEDLFYFAVNDYGAMQYGTVVTQGANTICITTPPLPSPPILASPQALTVGNPAIGPVGAMVGVTAVAGVLYLVTARRRAQYLAVAEAK
ncbi:MAG: hypothetical protein V4510_10265 [bacterium]